MTTRDVTLLLAGRGGRWRRHAGARLYALPAAWVAGSEPNDETQELEAA